MATKANISDMYRIANQVKSEAGKYKENVDEMYVVVNRLSEWKGEDNIAFVDKVDSYKKDYMRMHEILTQFGEIVNAAGMTYEETINKSKRNATLL